MATESSPVAEPPAACASPDALLLPAEVTVTSQMWFWPVLGAITAAGVIVRITFVSFASFERIANDATFYRTTAHNLVSGAGYAYPFPTDPAKAVATAAHPPLFSLLLAGFDLVGIQTVQGQRLALAFVSSGAIVLMGLAGRRVLNPTVGVVAAAIAALHPLWLQTVGSLMSESIYLVAIPFVLLSALRVLDRPSGWRFAVLGGAIGISALIRSEAIILILFLGLPLVLLVAHGWQRRFLVSAAVVAGCLVLVGPWVVRNEVQLGTSSLSTQEGLTLAGSYNPNTFSPGSVTFGSFDGPSAVEGMAFWIKWSKPPNGASAWNEVSIDHTLTHTSWDFARSHLSELPRVIMAREVSTWFLTGRGFQQSSGCVWRPERPI